MKPYDLLKMFDSNCKIKVDDEEFLIKIFFCGIKDKNNEDEMDGLDKAMVELSKRLDVTYIYYDKDAIIEFSKLINGTYISLDAATVSVNLTDIVEKNMKKFENEKFLKNSNGHFKYEILDMMDYIRIVFEESASEKFLCKLVNILKS